LEKAYNLSIQYKDYNNQLQEAEDIIKNESDPDILDM
jgi:hypothetical protein